MMRALSASRDGGVAFFGAGASAEVGFPSWDRLHEMYLHEFDPGAAATRGASDIRTDIDYHANRDPTRALCFVKRELGQPVHQTPGVVRLALETQALHYFFTTNFDEVLFEAAPHNLVAVYPDYQPMNACFVYLHGRAATAQSIHEDLVFGERGYQKAYDDSAGGLIKSKLRQFSPYPVVFIGFSMTDRGVMRALEEIADAARRQRGGAESGVSESIAPLRWYVLLPAPPKSDPVRLELKRQEETRLWSAGVRVIWYQRGYENEHDALIGVLRKMKRESRRPELTSEEPGIAESMLQAEALAEVEAPTSADLNRALAMLQGPPRIAVTFFERVAGLAWFSLLRGSGALDPQPSFETANGVRSAPYWHAAHLLSRTAAIAPREVADFLSQVETDNWVAVKRAVEILDNLDGSSAARAAGPIARSAVNAMSADQFLLHSLGDTVAGLDAGGKREAALVLTQTVVDELAELRPPLRSGLVSEFVRSAAPVLAGSESGLVIAEGALMTALDREYGGAEKDQARFTRPAIERNRKNHAGDTVIDLLIDAVRDTLLETEDAAARARTVERLLGSPWPTARRIGIAHCFLRREDLSHHEPAVINHENLADRHVFHELATLLDGGTGDLTESSVGAIRDFADGLHAGSSEEEQYEYRIWARVLPDQLLPEPLPAGDDDDDEPDRHLFRDVWMSDVFSPDPPLDAATFAARASDLDASGILNLVRDPAGSGVHVSWRHDKEAMWARLAEYAKEQRLLDLLVEMTSEDVGRAGSWQAIKAMPDVAADDPDRWRVVLGWAARRIDEVTDNDDLWSIASLIDTSSSVVPLSLSEPSRNIALRILNRAGRASWFEDSSVTEDSLLGGFLNHPAGKAMRALLELARREMDEVDPSTDTRAEVPQWFRSGVLEVIERDDQALGIDAWVGLGRYYALLVSRSADAVAFVGVRLEGEESELSTSTVAFWAGYLSHPSVWPSVLESLQESYRQHAPTLQGLDTLDEHLRESFFHHIVMGALRGVGDYENILQGTLSPSYTPQAREWTASALGRELERAVAGDDEQYRSVAIDHFRRYWSAHVDEIGGSDGAALATYLQWLDELGRPPREIGHLIEASLDQSTDGFDADQVLKYLASYVEEEPEGVLTLFGRCVEWARERGAVWFPREEADVLLAGLAPRVRDNPEFALILDGLAELGVISTHDIRRYRAAG